MPGTEYTYNTAYHLMDVYAYSQFVTFFSGSVSGSSVSGLPVTLVNGPCAENQSQILATAWTLYTVSAANIWQSFEIFNNSSDIVYLDLNGLTTVADITAKAMPIRASTYYSMSKQIAPGTIKLVPENNSIDVRIIGYF